MITFRMLSKRRFSTDEERQKFAEELAAFHGGPWPSTGVPFMTNDGDTYYWKFDSHNDWAVKFFPDRPDACCIVYRYGQGNAEGTAKERAFVAWIISRYYAMEVDRADLQSDSSPKETIPVSHGGFRGFTLVELLVVITIIAAIACLAAPAIKYLLTR